VLVAAQSLRLWRTHLQADQPQQAFLLRVRDGAVLLMPRTDLGRVRQPPGRPLRPLQRAGVSGAAAYAAVVATVIPDASHSAAARHASRPPFCTAGPAFEE